MPWRLPTLDISIGICPAGAHAWGISFARSARAVASVFVRFHGIASLDHPHFDADNPSQMHQITSVRMSSSERTMPGFDETYYRRAYPDLDGFEGNLLDHYLELGWKQGRDPSAGFSTNGYLSVNPDVMESGMNPLVHFLKYGLSEGRRGWERRLGAPAAQPLTAQERAPQV